MARKAILAACVLSLLTVGPAVAAIKIGNNGNNTLIGTSRADMLLGNGGNDTLRGKAGADRLDGGKGADNLNGGPGNDTVNGGPGNDTLDGGAGIDHLLGGPGRDTIKVRDGVRDFIGCGGGVDTVIADLLDSVPSDCESVTRPPAPVPTTEFLGFFSAATANTPFPSAPPAGLIPNGGTLTACAIADETIGFYWRIGSLSAPVPYVARYTRPDGNLTANNVIDPSLSGKLLRATRTKTGGVPNGTYGWVFETATGVPFLNVTVTRACV
jgi:Ca2+-binding RTX toxin-like protein